MQKLAIVETAKLIAALAAFDGNAYVRVSDAGVLD
jgi:hypothetical protein